MELLDFISKSPVTASRTYDDETFVYNLRDKYIAHLTDIASDAWNQIEHGKKFEDIINLLLNIYDVSFHSLKNDLVPLFIQYFKDGLLLINNKPFDPVLLEPKSLNEEYTNNLNKKLAIDEFIKEMQRKIGNRGHITGVSFEVTYRCNENCVHCYIPENMRHQKGELTFDEIINIIDQLEQANVLDITFTGGEPFVRPDFLEIVEYARSKFFCVNIFTNGNCIKKEDIRTLSKLFIKSLQTSIYSGIPSLHDAVTKVYGSFQKSVETLEYAAKCGIPINLKSPLLNFTAHEFQSIKKLAKKLNATHQIDILLSPKNDGDKSPLEFRITDEQKLKELLNDDEIGTSFTEERVFGKILSQEERDNLSLCGAGSDTILINPYGDVYPCPALPLLSGNLKIKTFAEIFHHSKELNEFRGLKNKDLNNDCRFCAVSNYCFRCPGLAYLENENQDVLSKPESLCKIAYLKKAIAEDNSAHQ